jgi:hypothetical protein
MPSGCQLANASGWLNLSGSVLGGMWAFAAIWLVILWRGFLSPDPTVQEQSAKINWGLNLIPGTRRQRSRYLLADQHHDA